MGKGALLSELRLVEARDVAERCAVDPRQPPAERGEHLRVGADIRLLLGDYGGAEQGYLRTLQLAPTNEKALLGMAQAARDRPETALSYAKRAAKCTETPGRASQWRTAGAVKIMGAA